MEYFSLGQPYDDFIALECLLRDGHRRIQQANDSGLIEAPKKIEVHVVGAGFSAILACHSLRSYADVQAIYDTSSALDPDIFPNVPVRELSDLKTVHKGIVVYAGAPGTSQEIQKQLDSLIAPTVSKVLLFAPNDNSNSIIPPDADGWLHCNMSYRCVNIAVNLSRRYRPVFADSPAPIMIMGQGLAAILARLSLKMGKLDCLGVTTLEQSQKAQGKNVPQDCHLLVTYAPQTFQGNEANMCQGMDCKSAQFLFRVGDATIDSVTIDGYTDCRLLGAGEEGMVFEATAPNGSRCTFKKFYEKEDRSSLLSWTTSLADAPPSISWMSEVKGVQDERAVNGIVYPDLELAQIPFMDECSDSVLKATVPYCLQVQQAYIQKGFAPSTMPGGIHAMCNRDGLVHFVDVGNLPPRLSSCTPDQLKRYVVKGLAGLTHETLFSGKNWEGLESAGYMQEISERLERSVELPQWYLELLQEVLSLPSEVFLEEATYKNLQAKHGLNGPYLPRELAEIAHNPILGVEPAPSVNRADGEWYQERLYQAFFYRPGEVEAYDHTGEKFDLIRDTFDELIHDSTYMDIGSNQGFFIAHAALKGAKECLGIEKDPQIKSQSERMIKAMGLPNVTVSNTRFAIDEPLPVFDVVSAFAVIHHLYLMDGSFPRLSDLVGHLAKSARKSLFVEYAHNPGYIERAEARHGRSFDDYTEEGLVTALEEHFDHVSRLAEVSSSRAIYLATHN